MRSGSERMHTWRRTPSTGGNFQTLIIWITVSYKASFNGSISVNKFLFFDFLNFCWVFQKFPFFLCHPVHPIPHPIRSELQMVQMAHHVTDGTACYC